MPGTPNEAEGRQALRDHVVLKASEARQKHGPRFDGGVILELLNDRAVVRYPVNLRFDASELEPGEFACARRLGESPGEGFDLFVHPLFEHRPEVWALLIAYHIPSMNYGAVVTHEEAELFGATLLGMDVEEYYRALCALADSLSRGPEG